MEDDEYEYYLQTVDLYLAEQCIDDQLKCYEKQYARLQKIEWDIRSKIYDIEQRRASLLEERRTLEVHRVMKW